MVLSNLIATAGVIVPFITFIVGGVFGFLVSRFTLTKNERLHHDQLRHQNSENIKASKDEKYEIFISAMSRYIQKDSPASLDDFLSISTSGNLYFNELKSSADAVLNGRVDKNSRDRSFIPSFVDAWNKSIPAYYDTLEALSKKIGSSYNGEFKRENYLSIIMAIEKYAPDSLIQQHVANNLSKSD